MKHLFSVRHGSCNSNHLSKFGEYQISILSESIKDIVDCQSVYLISSTAKRALESSEIIVSKLGLETFEKDAFLWPRPGVANSMEHYRGSWHDDALVDIVNRIKDKADGIIVVSHLEVANALVKKYMELYNIDSKFIELDKAQAGHFDLGSNSYQILPDKSVYRSE